MGSRIGFGLRLVCFDKVPVSVLSLCNVLFVGSVHCGCGCEGNAAPYYCSANVGTQAFNGFLYLFVSTFVLYISIEFGFTIEYLCSKLVLT